MTVSRNPPPRNPAPPSGRPTLGRDPRRPFPTGPPPTCTEQLLGRRSVEVPRRTRWLESTDCRATPSAEAARPSLHDRTERPAARQDRARDEEGTVRRGQAKALKSPPWAMGWPGSPSASTTSCSASRRCPARRRPAPRRGGPGTVAVGARPAAPVPGSAGGPRTPPAAALLLTGGRRRAVRRGGPRPTHFADAKTGARSVDRAPVGSRLGVGQGSGVVPGIRAAPPARTAASTDRCSAATPPGGTRTGPPSRS